ncbi:hypothetical protein JHK85_016712 [Glycine max]|nr:hypothetical protein JHK85_016712 [Glycine max]
MSPLKTTLSKVLNGIVSAIIFPELDDVRTILHWIKVSLSNNAYLLPKASRNSAYNVLLLTRSNTLFCSLFLLSGWVEIWHSGVGCLGGVGCGRYGGEDKVFLGIRKGS